MPGIPDKDASLHVNFPEIFRAGRVERQLADLAAQLDQSTAIVLNFEKCHWFDLAPLAQLLALLVTHCKPDSPLHVVGPSVGVLPYMYEYVVGLRQRLDASKDTLIRKELANRIARHLTERPALRRRSGAFLSSWGFFDAIEDHHENCHWYAARDKAVSLRSLKDHYGFVYGVESDRVGPLSVVTREEQGDTINRVNSEELIAGALKKYAQLEIFRSGAATNILFFEPFENVFQHGFALPSARDAAVISMRIRPAGKARPAAANAGIQAQWLEQHASDDIMEIVIADAGQGIAATLREELTETGLTDAGMSQQRVAWEALRYAFERSSTRKRPRPPGIRGLAWLKDRLTAAGGLVSVRSDGSFYEIGALSHGVAQNPAPTERNPDTDEPLVVPGVVVQLLLPLSTSADTEIDRYARWSELTSQSGFFDAERPQLLVRRAPRHLLQAGTEEEWTAFLADIASVPDGMLIALDLTQEHATRTALELLFTGLLAHQTLNGRVLILNCHRHNASRLPTVEAAVRFRRSAATVVHAHAPHSLHRSDERRGTGTPATPQRTTYRLPLCRRSDAT